MEWPRRVTLDAPFAMSLIELMPKIPIAPGLSGHGSSSGPGRAERAADVVVGDVLLVDPNLLRSPSPTSPRFASGGVIARSGPARALLTERATSAFICVR